MEKRSMKTMQESSKKVKCKEIDSPLGVHMKSEWTEPRKQMSVFQIGSGKVVNLHMMSKGM